MPLGARAIPHMLGWHTAKTSLWLQEHTQPGTFICGSAPQSERKVTNTTEAHCQASHSSAMAQSIRVPQKVVAPHFCRRFWSMDGQAMSPRSCHGFTQKQFPSRVLKRIPDSRDPMIFRLLRQDHHQRYKTLVFQHVLVYQKQAECQFIFLGPQIQKGLRQKTKP